MAKHFQSNWTKWDFINDILLELNIKTNEDEEKLEKALYKLNKKDLAILYHHLKETLSSF